MKVNAVMGDSSGQFKVYNISEKLIGVSSEDKVQRDTFFSIIEHGLAGEPMFKYVEYDKSIGVEELPVKSINIAFDKAHTTQVVVKENLKYESHNTGNPLRLHCIRSLRSDASFIRGFINECGRDDDNAAEKLALDAFTKNNYLNDAEWMRISVYVNAVAGCKVMSYEDDKAVFSQGNLSDAKFEALKLFYQLWIMCKIGVSKSKKIVLISVDYENEEVATVMYRLISLLSEIKDVAYVFFDYKLGCSKEVEQSGSFQLLSV